MVIAQYYGVLGVVIAVFGVVGLLVGLGFALFRVNCSYQVLLLLLWMSLW